MQEIFFLNLFFTQGVCMGSFSHRNPASCLYGQIQKNNSEILFYLRKIVPFS